MILTSCHKVQIMYLAFIILMAILEEVLSKLLVKPDLHNAKLVCRRWRFVVDELVGHEITVTNYGSLIRHLPCEVKQQFKLPTNPKDCTGLKDFLHMGIRQLTIGIPGMLIHDALTPTIVQISKEISDCPQTDYPHLIKSFSCFEPLSPNIFYTLAPMGNLKYLNMSLLSLVNFITGIGFENLSVFRSLTTLVISDTPAYPEFNSASVISPLNDFLKHVNAPNLTSLDITYPILSLLDIDEDSTRIIIEFIKQTNCLKKLSITVSSPDQNFSPPSKRFQYPAELMDEMSTLGKSFQLESVELKDNHLHSLRPSVQTKAWITFTKEQRNLHFLKFYLKSSIEFAEDVVKILKGNERTLINLDLSCFPCEISESSGDVYFVPIDGRALSKCIFLDTVKLSDKTINTIDFPRSLSSIYVDAMLSNMDAHNILLSEFISLKRVDLKDIRGGAPKGLGYGVTVDTLRQFVKMRMVQRLVIYAGSTDGKFPSGGIPNDDVNGQKRLGKRKPHNPIIMSSLLSQEDLPQDHVRIDWQLNKRGFYEENGYSSISAAYHCENEPRHSLYRCDTLSSSFH